MNDFTELLAASAFLVPLVIGFVQILKASGMNSVYAPLVSVACGVLAEFLIVGPIIHSPTIGITILLGIGVGLSASGVYSGADKVSTELNKK